MLGPTMSPLGRTCPGRSHRGASRLAGRCRRLAVRSDVRASLLALALAKLAGTTTPAGAQTPPDRFDFRASANLVGQATGADDIRAELVGSLDLFSDVRLGPVTLHVYVESNTSPRTNAVSARLPFANMDAGTALGADGDGRIQISELRLAWPLRERTVLHAGLMDLTGFLDVSRISNDENLFFLGQPFVNNPTIVFPDYTVATALVVDLPRVSNGRVALAVSSSHGLGDNPSVSYGRLLDLDAPDKGVFTAGRFRWDAERWSGSIGGWTSTGARMAGSARDPLPTRGLFAVLGISSNLHSLNGRVGVADGDAGTEPFFGLTYLGSIGANALGLGIARTPGLPSFLDRDAEHAEAFVRRSIKGVVYLTSSAQWLSAELLPGAAEEGVWIFGFRLSAAF